MATATATLAAASTPIQTTASGSTINGTYERTRCVDPHLRSVPHIADKIKQRIAEGKTFFSFEYFPPKTPSGVQNLYNRADRMSRVEPLFCDVTWGAGGSTSDLTLDLSGNIQKYLGLDVMMHLTCTNMPMSKVRDGLEGAKERGIRNILALRGDPPAGEEWQKCEDGFEHATDLVKFIRREYGDYFGICVAGYPEGHPSGYLENKMTYEEELRHLKEKMDAGADFIITQMFYDVDAFISFVRSCRDFGITATILPGILPIQSYTGFKKMTGFCKTKIPPHVTKALEPIKDNAAAVKEYGVQLGVEMCRKILKSGVCQGIHFYSLNLEKSVMRIIDQLDLIPRTESIRSYPWRPATTLKRRAEDVRPIYWANRPKSYLERTSTWDDFPNGRWGDNRSPAYGDLNDYHLLGSGGWTTATSRAELLETFGPISSKKDVVSIFVKFCKGEIKSLPWVESESLAEETRVISEPLTYLNRNGLLTINSQPRVNGAPSSDVSVGWGGPGGYVYQKAYIEFFAPEAVVEKMLNLVSKYPSLTIYAANAESDELLTNSKDMATCAVTWGVFPNREIAQPTVVDPQSFVVWKHEAFGVWTNVWAKLYKPDSKSASVLREIHDTHYLVNVYDNDFVGGDIFSIFKEVLADGETTNDL